MHQTIQQLIDSYSPPQLAQLAAQVLNQAGWLDDNDARAFFTALETDLREQIGYIGSDCLDAAEAEETHQETKARHQLRSQEMTPMDKGLIDVIGQLKSA